MKKQIENLIEEDHRYLITDFLKAGAVALVIFFGITYGAAVVKNLITSWTL